MWGPQRAEWASEILQWPLSFTVPTLLLCEGHRERKGPAQLNLPQKRTGG